MPFPLGLQRRHVHDNPATGVCGFAEANGEYIARDSEVLNRACQRKRVGWYYTHVALLVDETGFVEMLGVDDHRFNVREDLELVRTADIVAVTGRAIGYDPAPLRFTHLVRRERLDHAVLF